MELRQYTKSILELSYRVKYLYFANAVLLVSLLLVVVIHFQQDRIVILQVPGGGETRVESVFEKSAIDRGSQRAIILATVSAISQINSSNYEYQKVFIQNFLAPEVFTTISSQIDVQVKRMLDQHELGSY